MQFGEDYTNKFSENYTKKDINDCKLMQDIQMLHSGICKGVKGATAPQWKNFSVRELLKSAKKVGHWKVALR